MLWFNPCRRKGHDWRPYGWSVMGFGPYRYHCICSRCNIVAQLPAEIEELEDKDGSESD